MMTRRVAPIAVVLLALTWGGLLSGCQPRPAKAPPVFDAVRKNDVAAVNRYLKDGGDPNLADANGDTLLYVAAGPKGGAAVTAALLAGGAQPEAGNRDGRTPLQNAAGWCSTDVVAALLSGGADPLRPGGNGKTAFDSVCASPADRRAATLELLNGGISGGK